MIRSPIRLSPVQSRLLQALQRGATVLVVRDPDGGIIDCTLIDADVRINRLIRPLTKLDDLGLVQFDEQDSSYHAREVAV